MNQIVDPYSPEQIASLIETAGVRKVRLPWHHLITLGVLAGTFIAFGAMFYTVVSTDSSLGYGPTRLLGGVAFSLGLILVIIAGAELFTGNNLIVIAWAEHKVSSLELLRNWLFVYVSNFIGALVCAWMVYQSGILEAHQGALAQTALQIAQAKLSLAFDEAFYSGVLCNALVCLAVWMSMAAHAVSGKILAIILPIAAFVALGFEHSVANMYFLPLAILLTPTEISCLDLLRQLLPVTLGNIVGGSVCVALAYWLCYKAGKRDTD